MQLSHPERAEPLAHTPSETSVAAPLPTATYLDEIESFVNLGRWEWHVATGVLTCSAQLLRIYGVPSQEHMPNATSFIHRTHQADRTRVRASMMRALQTHAPFQFQQRIKRLDNDEERVLRTRGTIELGADGKPVRIQGYSQDITEVHASDQLAHERLKAAARRTLDREEQDRNRIALRIREDVAEPLLALGRKLSGAGIEGSGEAIATPPQAIAECLSVATTVGSNALQIIASLQPALLEERGLVPALRQEALRIGRCSAIPVNVEGEKRATRLPPGVENALFRIAQEALLNASRHSGCTLIGVSIVGTPTNLRLEVQDNGCGFEESAANNTEGKRGLAWMRERAEAISATFRVSSRAGVGTRVTVDYRS